MGTTWRVEVKIRGEWLDADRYRPFTYNSREEAEREMARQLASGHAEQPYRVKEVTA